MRQPAAVPVRHELAAEGGGAWPAPLTRRTWSGWSLSAAATSCRWRPALAGSRQDGEDLLQAALERVLRKPRVVDSDAEGYLRRVLYNLAADGWRRRGRWRQRRGRWRQRATIPASFRQLPARYLPLTGGKDTRD